ncbi:hypothetical protein DSO57_1032362 [Entomophthora muscae]|uniref:Uncharacterized protein n=1 Tax=Entomophthora muscae TaxID=34485 RepID=A0ACC2U9F7_9FUNG|nr:hypothetical protein DSO57_1032362 [Entomophthora muscae]
MKLKASLTAPGTGFEPPHRVAKQKHRQLQKPTGRFKPPTTHQGRFEAVQTALTYLSSLNCPPGETQPGASIKTGLGELAASTGIGAPSSNSIIGLGAPNATLDQIFWVL